MFLTVPVVFSADVTSKGTSGKVRKVDLHVTQTMELAELTVEEAPVATEWIDRRLMPDGRVATTRYHDGKHFRCLHERMFDGYHSMSEPVLASELTQKLSKGMPAAGPLKPLGDDTVLSKYRNGQTKPLYDARKRFAEVDQTDFKYREALITSMIEGLIVIDGHIWYACSEPCLIVVAPTHPGDVHRILTTTEDDPMHDILINRGAVKFRADRHADALAMIEDAGEEPSGTALSSRITVHMPETIEMDDDGAALVRCADEAIAAIGFQAARQIRPEILTALASLMQARSDRDMEGTGHALADLGELIDLGQYDLNHAAVLERWSQRDRDISFSL